tara:strand:- start:99 stop:773 length:675 start_codon:yes stop_codon:yes gene_type:complete
MNFKKDRYIIIKEAIPELIARFLTDYLLLKREVSYTMFKYGVADNTTTEWGRWDDDQVPGTYSHYSDVAMETLLAWMHPIMKKHTGLDLAPMYSYTRIYRKGDELERHKDRPSCAISTTMALGFDKPYPIYLDPTGGANSKGIEVNLNPGDMLVYRGCDLEHWRKPFEGEDCVQVFLHYNEKGTFTEHDKYDGRFHLGLPDWFRKDNKGNLNGELIRKRMVVKI